MKQESVRNWMTPTPVAINPNTSLTDAQMLLKEHDIRRLPVVDEDGCLSGIVTLGDIREASPPNNDSLSFWEVNELLSKLKVEEILSSDPITVYETDTIAAAANLMLENKISGLPVVDLDGVLLGIITESDIFRLVVQSWDDTGDLLENEG